MISFNCKYNNVYWFLIDGLRPDFLKINGNKEVKENFFDELIRKGTMFSNVVTAGSGTFTSMHSIFSSLLPSYNGAEGWAKQILRNFNQEIFTITDYFQLAGYETFMYSDTDEGKPVPLSGFKVCESSGYLAGCILTYTDYTKNERRDNFIRDVNTWKGNKFIYHHVDLLHDLNCGLGNVWTHEAYAENIAITAREFKKLYYEYSISENDLVIISADHGVILNKDFMRDGIENGERQYEESVISFFAVIGKDIAAQILPNRISALDEGATILHLALGTVMPGQGEDQYDYMQKGIYHERIFFREKGSYCVESELQNAVDSDLYYVRDGDWKYVYGKNDPRCEWLINLAENEDYKINLKDKYPDLVKKYHEMLKQKFEGKSNYRYLSSLGFDKKAVNKMFSLILQMKNVSEETLESLLEMGGVYEIIIDDSRKLPSDYRENYKIKIVKGQTNIQEMCEGEWCVYIQDNGGWSMYFLSDLYRYILSHKNENIRIIGKNYIAFKRESIGLELIDLFEKNEVRTVTHPCNEYISKKYILFGCGKFGKKALDYCGKENVYCFADNDQALVGKERYGKKIISFNELKEVSDKYVTVISTGREYAYQIREKLESNGIHEYLFLDYGLL